MPTKSTPFKDYVKFDILGVSDLISEEDKKRIKTLEAEKEFIINNPNSKASIDHRPVYMIDLYSPEQQVRIFNLQDRKGLSIVFMNVENYKCKIAACAFLFFNKAQFYVQLKVGCLFS